jgi:hypothetical protein
MLDSTHKIIKVDSPTVYKTSDQVRGKPLTPPATADQRNEKQTTTEATNPNNLVPTQPYMTYDRSEGDEAFINLQKDLMMNEILRFDP